MYTADNFKKSRRRNLYIKKISPDRDFKILQLTDLHLGFGLFFQETGSACTESGKYHCEEKQSRI